MSEEEEQIYSVDNTIDAIDYLLDYGIVRYKNHILTKDQIDDTWTIDYLDDIIGIPIDDDELTALIDIYAGIGKVYSIRGFLLEPDYDAVRNDYKEPKLLMLIPVVVLAVITLVLGLYPTPLIELIQNGIAARLF